MLKVFEVFLLIMIFFLVWFCGAYFHEADMSRNFEKYGDAKAWFYDIKNDCDN